MILTLILLSNLTAKCVPNPELVNKIPIIMDELVAEGWQPKIVDLCRSWEEQKEKVDQGYSQTMFSRHLTGKAVDIVDRRYYWDKSDSFKFWKDLGKACKKQGLVWGGDWKGFPDVAHCEMK